MFHASAAGSTLGTAPSRPSHRTPGLHIDDVRQRYPFFSSFTGLVLSYEVGWACVLLGIGSLVAILCCRLERLPSQPMPTSRLAFW